MFLDEVGELPGPLQAKLLRVLEDQRVQPVGAGWRSIPVDVRIVAATNVDLWSSGFRSDLLARLADWVLHLPPLIERRADVLPLWRYFEHKASSVLRAMTSEFAEALLLHEWPRNIRELRQLANGVCTLTRPEAGLDLPRAASTAPEADPRPLRTFAGRGPRTSAPVAGSSSGAESSGYGIRRWRRRHQRLRRCRARPRGAGRPPQRIAGERQADRHRQRMAPKPGFYRWLKRLGLDANDYR